MVFATNTFLFLFLPLFLAAYYLTPQRFRSSTILAGSCLFLAWWRIDFLLLFGAVTAWNYAIGSAIEAAGVRSASARRWLTLGIVVDLAVLVWFRYADLDVGSFNGLMAASGAEALEWTRVLLPLAVLIYTLEAIGYLVDVYRGEVRAARSFADFACCLALFPHLIAGPLLRYRDIAPQLAARSHGVEPFVAGALRFMQGFIKKVFIADTLAPLVAAGFALPDPTMIDAWLAALAFTAQLYFAFSGYCDMAVGLALMLGLRLPENFDRPYASQSITEFWRRWHRSLADWLREYVHEPLGGDRAGRARTPRNLLLTGALAGLWYGSNWTFLLWGAWHGAWLAVEHALGRRTQQRSFSLLRCLSTLLLVVLGWVMLRADSVGAALVMYRAMFRFDGASLSDLYATSISALQLATLTLAWGLIAIGGLGRARTRRTVQKTAWRPAPALALILPLFTLAVLKLSAQGAPSLVWP